MTIQKQQPDLVQDAAILALNALAWVMSDRARALRFLDLTGLTPEGLRAAAGSADTQRAVLDFLCAHEPDLVQAAEALAIEPQRLAGAREGLTP